LSKREKKVELGKNGRTLKPCGDDCECPPLRNGGKGGTYRNEGNLGVPRPDKNDLVSRPKKEKKGEKAEDKVERGVQIVWVVNTNEKNEKCNRRKL